MTETVDKSICVAIEIILVLLVVVTPWAFGCVHPPTEAMLACGVAAIVALWALRVIVSGTADLAPRVSSNVALLGMLGLFLIASVQFVSLPTGLVRVLSPSTYFWVEQIKPQVQEEFSDERLSANATTGWEAGRRLSLNPRGSFEFALNVVTIAALCVAIGSLRSPQLVLRRLAVTATIVGVALAFVAIVQKIGSPPRLIYWYFETRSSAAFGPFISKNHYPYFANVCIGLACGLLLEQTEKSSGRWIDKLQNPIAIWLVAAIAIMSASIVLSLSRGGMIALAVAFAVGILVRCKDGKFDKLTVAALIILPAVLGFLFWVGSEWFVDRVNTLAEAETYQEDGRWNEWQAALQIALDFPLFGAGGDTYRHLELINRDFTVSSGAARFAYRAENEYLDVLSEYGLLGFLSLMVVCAGVIYIGIQAGRQHALGLGAFMALVTVMAHSFVDFGIRIPANTLIATAVLALLIGIPRQAAGSRVEEWLQGMRQRFAAKLGDFRKAVARHVARHKLIVQVAENPTLVRRTGTVAVAGAALVLSVAFVQVKMQAANVHAWRTAGYRALQRGDLAACVNYLHASTTATPGRAMDHIEAARVILDAAYATPDIAQDEGWTQLALFHCTRARELCPLPWKPLYWLSRNEEYLPQADTEVAYLARACLLNPTHPRIQWRLGEELFELGQVEAACQHFRNSLRINGQYLSSILAKAEGTLDAEQLVSQVLPDDPRIALEAGTLSESSPAREIYLQHTLQLIDSQEQPSDYDREAIRANLLLGREEQAVELLQAALRTTPDNYQLRFQLADLLLDLSEFEEAEREIRFLTVYRANDPAIDRLNSRLRSLRRASQSD